MTANTPRIAEPFAPRDHRPYHVQVEVTWRCNWRCVHCYQDDHSREWLDGALLSRLFGELRACGTMHLIVTGGEPLVRRDIFEVLGAARARGLGITLYTNGHAIDAAAARRLSSLIAQAEISILAGTDDVHDQLSSVKGSSVRAWAAVRHLLDAGVDVVVKTPVLAPALTTLRALERRLGELGIEWHTDVDIARSYAGDPYPLAYRLDAEQLDRFYRDVPAQNPARRIQNSDPGAPGGLCLAGRQYAFIDARGFVYPCLNFKGACDVAEARGEPALPVMGNVREAPFSQIWNDAPIVQVIRGASRGHFPPCGSCASGGRCTPCMAANYEEHGDLFRRAESRCATNHVAHDSRVARRHLPIARG